MAVKDYLPSLTIPIGVGLFSGVAATVGVAGGMLLSPAFSSFVLGLTVLGMSIGGLGFAVLLSTAIAAAIAGVSAFVLGTVVSGVAQVVGNLLTAGYNFVKGLVGNNSYSDSPLGLYQPFDDSESLDIRRPKTNAGLLDGSESLDIGQQKTGFVSVQMRKLNVHNNGRDHSIDAAAGKDPGDRFSPSPSPSPTQVAQRGGDSHGSTTNADVLLPLSKSLSAGEEQVENLNIPTNGHG